MTENKELYFGHGTPEMFDDYMDFINYVFGFNGTAEDFKRLLPKLYKYEYEPAVSSFVATEGGKLKAVIGVFDHDISVCGTRIKTRGVGNVAVHPYTRGGGYMRKLLNMALDEMVSDGVALSVLGGRRQRYNYFSYDKLGQAVTMSFNDDNMRHTFGKDRNHTIKLVHVKAEDEKILASIKDLAESRPFYAFRESDKYFDILSSWEQKIYAGFEGDTFVGYTVVKGRDMFETLVTNVAKLPEFVCAVYDRLAVHSMRIKVPVFLPEYIDAVGRICESYSLEPCKSFSVLNYKEVVGAFMKLKATYSEMPNGELVLDIDGRGGHERIEIAVSNGNISVEHTEKDADITLSHLDAMNLLFASVCPKREQLPIFAKIWLPLPLYLYSTDAV